MITVSVSRGGNPVADADIAVSRSRADGGTDTGAVGDITNNGDGTYTATYTPSAMVGRVNLTATDSVSGASGIDRCHRKRRSSRRTSSSAWRRLRCQATGAEWSPSWSPIRPVTPLEG